MTNQHGNLDSKSANEVIKLLKSIAKDKLVIIVTHNIEQVEDYATRIIKMKDGNIIEDKKVKEITEKVPEIKKIKCKYNLINTYKLGIRNTFNIASKFVLLFLVFLFVILSIFAEYSVFNASESEKTSIKVTNINFTDTSPNRILIKKYDKTEFTEEDYENIEAKANIDYILSTDYFIDRMIVLHSENRLKNRNFIYNRK